MNLSDLMATDVDDVFMVTDDFAETMIRYIGGDSGNTSSIVGIFTPESTQPNDGRGRGYDHMATLALSSAVTLKVGDALKHGNDRYEVKTVGDEVHGMRTCELVRYEADVRGGKVFRNGDI